MTMGVDETQRGWQGLGDPPIVANVLNTLGLVPGSLSGTIGYLGATSAGAGASRMPVIPRG
jgi:hypothetical protein